MASSRYSAWCSGSLASASTTPGAIGCCRSTHRSAWWRILAAWLLLIFAGYGFIFWGLEGEVGVTEALELSGSSLFTLGFLRPETFWLMMVSFSEAAIGLFLLALLITYLPSMYGAFSADGSVGVTALSVRAGEPPSGREMIWRFWRLERMYHAARRCGVEWERWFVDVEETHTSLPALVFFRSPQPDHSWVTAAGAVLDGAALDGLERRRRPRRAGGDLHPGRATCACGRIADYFRHPVRPPTRPGRVRSRSPAQEWDEAVDFLADDGVPIKADRDQAWRDFAGWRVNYDTVLLGLGEHHRSRPTHRGPRTDPAIVAPAAAMARDHAR